MRIDHALGLRPRETVAFTGGGGKTTIMFRLAAELAASGCAVVTSTTTRLAVRETALPPCCLACEDADAMVARLPAALAHARHVLAVGCVQPEYDRVDGLPAETLRRIAALPDVDFLLVEADGSRELPFKAPGAHEPALPDFATTVVLVVGLDALGQPLTSDIAHRPEIIAELAQCTLGALITPAVVAAVLRHPQGGGKNLPAGARLVPFLNKADCLPGPAAAHALAEALLAPGGLAAPWIERVLIGTATTADPVWQVVHRSPPQHRQDPRA